MTGAPTIEVGPGWGAAPARRPALGVVHVVVPAGIDDSRQPSGGNRYDRRMLDGLAQSGWHVVEHRAPGDWPAAGAAGARWLTDRLNAVPPDMPVIVDGLIGSAAVEPMLAASRRLRLVPLVHMPLGDAALGDPARADPARADPAADHRVRAGERAVLASAAAVLTTSDWTRQHLIDRYALSPDRVVVARPGVDPAPLAPGSATGAEVLCVAAVIPGKGQRDLVAALAQLPDLSWRCTLVGSLTRDPGYVADLRQCAARAGLEGRLRLAGPRQGVELKTSYASADVFVLPSRAETYGMVVVEALARGLPVIATDVGGLPEAFRGAVGAPRRGGDPGLLVPPGDAEELAAALRRWLTDAPLRHRLRANAARRRAELADWRSTIGVIDELLRGLR